MLLGVLAAGAAVHQHKRSHRDNVALKASLDLRDRLGRTLRLITDTHLQTMLRSRNAMLDQDLHSRIDTLERNRSQYLREISRLAQNGAQLIKNAPGPQQSSAPQKAVQTQFERLEVLALEVADALDLQREAALSQDPDGLSGASFHLDQADASMHIGIQGARNLVLRFPLPVLQTDTSTPQLSWLWLALLWAPIALWLAVRPLLSLSRVVESSQGMGTRPHSPPKSAEEARILNELTLARQGVADRDAKLQQRSVDYERMVQLASRANHEIALLRLYNENLVNSIRSAIVVSDAAGRVTSSNRTARAMLEIKDKAQQQAVEDLVLYKAVLDHGTKARAELERAMTSRAVIRMEGVPYPASSGKRLLDITIAPYLDESGAARGLLWVCDDVTDAVHTKNQLLAAEHLATVGRLSAQVAHEIRNPLSAIGLNAELLEEEFASGLTGATQEEALSLLGAIATEIERLTQVTEGYLELARMPRPHPKEADINQMVSDLFAMLGEEMKNRNIEVSLDFATPEPRAWVDPGQLRQAMLNIVRNSRDAMASGGHLQVRTAQRSEFSELEITDSGGGISPKICPGFLSPFIRPNPRVPVWAYP